MIDNILFLVNIDDNKKAGLYRAVINRISSLIDKYDESINFKVLSLVKYDSLFIRLIKSLSKNNIKNINYKTIKKQFKEKDIIINYTTYANNIFTKLGEKYFPKLHLNRIFRTLEKKENLLSYNILNVHFVYPNGCIASIIKKRYNIPFVLTCHGSDIHSVPYKNKKIKKLIVECLESADSVIFVSENLLNQAKALGYNKKNHAVIPNGINIDDFINKDYEIKKGNANKKVIGYVGNLFPVKRVDRFPYIFKIIKDYNPDVKFVIIGDGYLRENIENSCKNLNLDVEFVGMVKPDDVGKYMREFDVLILPSRNEGWPCVILEAFASGITVVGSNNGGIPEAISNYGTIVNEGEDFDERFAKAVCQTLNKNIDKGKLISYACLYSWDHLSSTEFNLISYILFSTRIGVTKEKTAKAFPNIENL